MALTDNLVSFWELEESSDGSAPVTREDAHGTNDLTDNNTTPSTTGKVGNCCDFERGNSERLSIADNTDLSTGNIDFTANFWINGETLDQNPILGKWQWGGSGQNEWVAWTQTDAKPQFSVSSTGSNTVTVSWGSALSTATWYMITCWHDATADKIYITVNANATPAETAHTLGVFDGTREFAIGGSASNFFDGLIDQVGFWKRVLTSDERTSLYNSGNGLSYAAMAGGGGRTTKNTRAWPLGTEIGMNWRGQV